jgi:hypothetical protein
MYIRLCPKSRFRFGLPSVHILILSVEGDIPRKGHPLVACFPYQRDAHKLMATYI